ncbi:hypothetical protein BJ170DRAFT_620820 [Xylariales sp. AK1849]|nr:hypothetical protein BJ170DRAFT_620820 [Xylariales sp. AK1849]
MVGFVYVLLLSLPSPFPPRYPAHTLLYSGADGNHLRQVTCQGGTNGSMIFSSMCGGPFPPWTCTYDADCNAHC